MSVKLKIKAKSLAIEAKLIREEEIKIKNLPDKYRDNRLLFSLSDHRKKVVGRESRATHLARTFMKGRARKIAEQKVRDPVALYSLKSRILAMVRKYGDRTVTDETIKEWLLDHS